MQKNYSTTNNSNINMLQQAFDEVINRHQDEQAWKINADFVSEAFQALYDIESKGVEDGLTPYYYSNFNNMIEDGLAKSLHKDHKLPHMGLELILDEFMLARLILSMIILKRK